MPQGKIILHKYLGVNGPIEFGPWYLKEVIKVFLLYRLSSAGKCSRATALMTWKVKAFLRIFTIIIVLASALWNNGVEECSQLSTPRTWRCNILQSLGPSYSPVWELTCVKFYLFCVHKIGSVEECSQLSTPRTWRCNILQLHSLSQSPCWAPIQV